MHTLGEQPLELYSSMAQQTAFALRRRPGGKFCGHYGVKTPQALVKDVWAGVCPYCRHHPASLASASARKALQVLDSVVRSGATGRQLLALEAKVLKGKWGAPDFILYPSNIVVEVDGEQHFDTSMHGTSWKAQSAMDKEKDVQYWRRGMGVVRVHHWDVSSTAWLVKLALRERRRNPGSPFIIYSRHQWKQSIFASQGATESSIV